MNTINVNTNISKLLQLLPDQNTGKNPKNCCELRYFLILCLQTNKSNIILNAHNNSNNY